MRTCPRGSGTSAPRSRGATTSSTRSNVACSRSSACSQAGRRSMQSSRCASGRAMRSTPRWRGCSTRACCSSGSALLVGSFGSGCWSRSASSPRSACSSPGKPRRCARVTWTTSVIWDDRRSRSCADRVSRSGRRAWTTSEATSALPSRPRWSAGLSARCCG